jgi:hypothetical protein
MKWNHQWSRYRLHKHLPGHLNIGKLWAEIVQEIFSRSSLKLLLPHGISFPRYVAVI